ncbi:MAG: hypothetical protein V8R64_10440 [Thomasclavelia sp.]
MTTQYDRNMSIISRHIKMYLKKGIEKKFVVVNFEIITFMDDYYNLGAGIKLCST